MDIPGFQILRNIFNIPSYDSTNGNLVDAAGNAIVVTDVVADWAALQAIPKTSGNNNIVMHIDGLGVAGSDWRYKHSYSRWFAVSEPILKESYTAITHGATLTTEELGFEYQLLNDYGGQNKSILQNGDFLIVSSLLTKTGTADAIRPTSKLDTVSGGVTGTALSAITSPGATNIHVGMEQTFQRVSATKLRLVNQVHTTVSGNNIAATTAWQGDVTVANMDTTNGVYFKFTFKCASNVGDSAFKIENYHIRLRAGREG